MRQSANMLAAALFAATATVPAFAQELIAWPIGSSHSLRVVMPGMPVRPLPPRPILPPRPFPRPVPTPVPAPADPAAPELTTPLALSGYRVEGKLSGRAAELVYRVSFHNPTPQRLEGVLLMPIPADTVFSGFTMTVAGKTMKAELLQAGEAATIYENIVRSLRDPGLLELVGERLVRARVFPIEPNSTIEVEMKVSQLLAKSGGLYSLSVPMRSTTMSGATNKGASVRLSLDAEKPIRTLYSPIPDARIARSGERKAAIAYDTPEKAPRDFTLFFSLEEDPLAAGLLSFKEPGEDGYFLLSLAPSRKPAASAIVPKDIVFIVDRSGSMEEGGKMSQAKSALSYCLRKLSPGDRFGIVDFATDANLFERSLMPATADNTAAALRYVERIESAGGTNIEAGLGEGLKLLTQAPGRMPMLFFLTDGLPTVGQTNVEALLREAAGKNSALKARLFSFGVGDDVNTLLLDKLAEMNRGARDYVRPEESIEAKVSTLYQKVDKPALTDVRIEWRGVEGHQLYPSPVTDIFYGSELTLMGRFKGSGTGKLIITGKAGAATQRFEFPVNFPDKDERHAFLPRLWANLKVAHELDALRLAGGAPSPEAIESLVRLAKRYGIVTPYTSFLITEEGFDMTRARGEAERSVRAMNQAAQVSGFSGGAGRAREAQRDSGWLAGAADAFKFGSVDESASASVTLGGAPAGKTSPKPSSAPAALSSRMADAEKEERAELKRKGLRAAETRSIGGKTFYLRGGVWTDGDYDSEGARRTVVVEYMGQKYFELLADVPGLGKYLSLGEKLIVVYDGVVYKIGA